MLAANFSPDKPGCRQAGYHREEAKQASRIRYDIYH